MIVIGMFNDDIDMLKKFSVEVCCNKFVVVVDVVGKVIKDYDVFLRMVLGMMVDCVFFLIVLDGKVVVVYVSMDFDGYIGVMMKVVEKFKK